MVQKEINLRAELKSYKDIWKADKELLKMANADLPIRWQDELPGNEDARKILISFSDSLMEPKEPIQLDSISLNDTVENLCLHMQKEWGAKLHEMPSFEILSFADFLPRIHELQREANEMCGSGSLTELNPAMISLASHKVILMPENYIANMPVSDPTLRGRYEPKEFPWNKPYFESVLYEELNHALFRQLRGEWGKGYGDYFKAVEGHEADCVSTLNETLALFSKKRLAMAKKQKWALYAAADSIQSIWMNGAEMGYYRVVEAMAKEYPLSRIAMLDHMSSGTHTLYVTFFDNHPKTKMKEKAFYGK